MNQAGNFLKLGAGCFECKVVEISLPFPTPALVMVMLVQ
jgi:hypothetical protein